MALKMLQDEHEDTDHLQVRKSLFSGIKMNQETTSDYLPSTKDSSISETIDEPEARALSNVNIFSFNSLSSWTFSPSTSPRHEIPIPPRPVVNPVRSPSITIPRTARPTRPPRPKSLLDPSFAPTTAIKYRMSQAPSKPSMAAPTLNPRAIFTRKPTSVTTIPRDPSRKAPSNLPIRIVTTSPVRLSPPSKLPVNLITDKPISSVAPKSPSYVSSSSLSPSVKPSRRQALDNPPPRNDPCPLSSDGSFGINPSTNTSQDIPYTVLSYYYQLETQLTSPTLNDLARLVNKVELAVSKTLVQTLVSGCRASLSTIRQRDMKQGHQSRLLSFAHNLQHQHRVLSSIQGISPLPVDIIQGGATCVTPPLNPNNTCIVILGGVTLYGNLTSYNDQQIAMDAIKSSMIHGSLSNADSSIVRLTYLNDGTSKPPPQPTTSFHPSLNTLSITAIASSLIVLIFALIATRRYISQRHKALLLKHDDNDKDSDSIQLVEIVCRHHEEGDKQSLLADEKDEIGQGDSIDDSFTFSDNDFYEDASEVIVLNELGEELWLSLGDNKPPSENASHGIMGTDQSTTGVTVTDHSSVQSQTFNTWLYSDDSTFV